MSTHRRSPEDFQSEIEAHLALETDRLIAAGMSPDEARSTARRTFGNTTGAVERFYESTRPLMRLEQLAADLRFALRSLRKTPGFAAIAVLTLALGIGVNATIFSMLSTAMFRPLPVANAARLMTAGRAGNPSISYPDYRDFRDQNHSFDGIAATLLTESSLDAGSKAHAVGAEVVTGNYAQVVGLGTALGKWFTTDDEPSAINRLIVAEEGVPVERRYSFPVGIFTREVKAPRSSSDLGKGQRRERDPHGHDTGYLTFPRPGQPRSRLGRGGRGYHSAPVPDL